MPEGGTKFMSYSAEELFKQRFSGGIEVVYCSRQVDGEERQLNQKRLSDAVKAAMAAILKREPTPEEFLGIVPIAVSGKKGAA
jgi:hypothetical protein